MDAENMVQETYLRYQATSPGTILSLKAYLTTIISLLAQNVTFLGDGGGKVKGTATRPVSGCRAVARFFFRKSSAFMARPAFSQDP